MPCIDESVEETLLRLSSISSSLLRGRRKAVPDGLIPKTDLGLRFGGATFPNNENPSPEIEDSCSDINSALQEDEQKTFQRISERMTADIRHCMGTFEGLGEYSKTIYAYVDATSGVGKQTGLSAGREKNFFPSSSNHVYLPESIDARESSTFPATGYNTTAGGSYLPSRTSRDVPVCWDFLSDIVGDTPENFKCEEELRGIVAHLTLGVANIQKGLEEENENKCLDGTSGYYDSTTLNPQAAPNIKACIEKSATASALKRSQKIMEAQSSECIPYWDSAVGGVYDSTSSPRRRQPEEKGDGCQKEKNRDPFKAPKRQPAVEGPA